MKKILHNGVEFEYDVKSLLKELETFEWEEPYGNEHVDGSYMSPTQKDFDKKKEKFKKQLQSLDEKVLSLIKTNVQLTQKNILHKSKRYVLIDSDICVSYSDHYGSHAYDNVCLHLERKGDKKAKLVIGALSFQDSF
jgi:transcriptional regulator of met regulon